jgi:putative peptide maturation system protein
MRRVPDDSPAAPPLNPIDRALVAAVPFLRALPRTRDKPVDDLLSAFRAAHPGVEIELVIDRPPGHPEVDYDLLLSSQDGTIAIGWRPDCCNPWNVQYAEHWASNLVLSVNGRDLSVQEALQALRLGADAAYDLQSSLVHYCLIDSTISMDPPAVSGAELQEAADNFRVMRGLTKADEMHRWLEQSSLSLERFEALMRARLQAHKLKDKATRDEIRQYFENHRDSLAQGTVVSLNSPSEKTLKKLANPDTIRQLTERLWSTDATKTYARVTIDIKSGLLATLVPAGAPIREETVVGPYKQGREFRLVQLIRRTPAKLDELTRQYKERNLAEIKWHWM